MQSLIFEKRENFRTYIRKNYLNQILSIQRNSYQCQQEETFDQENCDFFSNLVFNSSQQFGSALDIYLSQTYNNLNSYINLLTLFLNNTMFQFFLNESDNYKIRIQQLLQEQLKIIQKRKVNLLSNQFLLALLQSDLLTFEDLRESFTYCCKQLQQDQFELDSILFMIKMIQKYENQIKFFWNELNYKGQNGETLWIKILDELQSFNLDVNIHQQILIMIHQLLIILPQQNVQLLLNNQFIQALKLNIQNNNTIAFQISMDIYIQIINRNPNIFYGNNELFKACCEKIFNSDLTYLQYISILECFIFLQKKYSYFNSQMNIGIIIQLIKLQLSLSAICYELILQLLQIIITKSDKQIILTLIKNQDFIIYIKQASKDTDSKFISIFMILDKFQM